MTAAKSLALGHSLPTSLSKREGRGHRYATGGSHLPPKRVHGLCAILAAPKQDVLHEVKTMTDFPTSAAYLSGVRSRHSILSVSPAHSRTALFHGGGIMGSFVGQQRLQMICDCDHDRVHAVAANGRIPRATTSYIEALKTGLYFVEDRSGRTGLTSVCPFNCFSSR